MTKVVINRTTIPVLLSTIVNICGEFHFWFQMQQQFTHPRLQIKCLNGPSDPLLHSTIYQGL
jgi:hypothetical protein